MRRLHGRGGRCRKRGMRIDGNARNALVDAFLGGAGGSPNRLDMTLQGGVHVGAEVIT